MVRNLPTLELTSADLRTLADQLDKLATLGVDVHELRLRGGVLVRVQRRDDQRNGSYYTVTRITAGGGVLRQTIHDAENAEDQR